jgi:hypothetical protein
MLTIAHAGNEWGRVHLDESIPCAAVGCVFGALIGLGVESLWRRFPQFGRAALILSTGALCAGVGGMFGWIGGDGLARAQWESEKFAPLGMGVGALGGALIGMVVGKMSERRPELADFVEQDEPH